MRQRSVRGGATQVSAVGLIKVINSIKLEFCTSFPQNWKDGTHLEAGEIKGVITEEFLLELGLERREESVENREGTAG